MNIYLEIFGYIGTALVIVSMMMTSVLKLRIINMCGSLISLIYAVLCNTWPVVVLNACLLAINMFHTIRQLRQKVPFDHVVANAQDRTVLYFLDYYKQDVEKYFPGFRLDAQEDLQIHVTFVSGEMVGLLIGTREAETFTVSIDYAIPRYRDLSVGKFIFPKLKEQGIKKLIAPVGAADFNAYLTKIGFVADGDRLIKEM